MRNRKQLWTIGGAALATAALVVAYQAGRARAGVPATDPLLYTGFLEADGEPVTGTRSIGVAIFAQEKEGEPIAGCAGEATDRDVTRGHFSVPIPKACVGAIEAAEPAELWVGVEVDGAELSPRAKIAAVPFALQARQAGGLTEKGRTELTSPECPAGYSKLPSSPKGQVWCAKGADEVVRVGVGATAFWIDRFEATVWSKPDGTGLPYFTTNIPSINAPPGLPASGDVAATVNLEAYTLSKSGVLPARYITWFQAEQLCRGSGKRLPTRTEWLTAVQGTPDPTAENDGDNGPACHTCDKDDNVQCSAGAPRLTAVAQTAGPSPCVSRWGAEDMIGNLWEWTDEWFAHSQGVSAATPWYPPADFRGDGTFNIQSYAPNGDPAAAGNPVIGVPAAGLRGGSWQGGLTAGAFALSLQAGPSAHSSAIGFRCVIPR